MGPSPPLRGRAALRAVQGVLARAPLLAGGGRDAARGRRPLHRAARSARADRRGTGAAAVHAAPHRRPQRLPRHRSGPALRRAFAFAADQSLRPWSRLFLVHPETCMVLLTDEQLTITFGRWSLSTTPANVVDATLTGPYQWWKVAGPAHLSVGDRGVTFATTAARGVCLAFAEPVPAIDPFGAIRHPAATVTVADPEGFRDAVLAAGRHRRRTAPRHGPRTPVHVRAPTG